MTKLLLLFLILFHSLLIIAQDASTSFEAGNNYYQRAEYDSALIYYQSIIEEGKTSAALYYNIGNSYYKKGLLAEAILYYERAAQLSPDDVDIKQNLEIAHARTIDKIDPLPQIFYKKWISELKNFFSPDTWAIFTVIFFWLFFVSLAVYILSGIPSIRKLFFASAIVFFIFMISSAAISYDRYRNITSSNSAIIFDSSVYVKSSPEDKSTNLFLLHEGTKVEILEELSNWRKIKLANGSVGWIKEGAIRVI